MARTTSRTSIEFQQRTRRSDSLKGVRQGFTIVELLIVVVVIAILAAITIVAYNGITGQAKTAAMVSELRQWKTASEIHKVQNGIECPDGYVFIYGNSVLGTNDFCVMKYEAKNDGSGSAVSTATGTPWMSISQTNAIAAAAATGGHLITEAEWMTIAADVLSVKYNWSGGEVGSGFIYSGHTNSNPASALAASTDDTDNLFDMTGGFGDTVGANNSRVLHLTSGDAIWDFSGNVNEWTDATISGDKPGASGFAWRQYPSVSSWGSFPASSRPSALASLPSLGSISTWTSSQGIGSLDSNSDDASLQVFRRGGTWSAGSNAGVLMLQLGGTPSGVYVGIGFRVSR